MNKQKVYDTNLMVFKLIGVYQLIDPDSQKKFDFNIYHLVNIVLIIFTKSMTILGLSGFVYKVHKDTYNNNDVDTVFIMFYIVCSIIGNFKILVIIYNAKKFWNVFEITHESFLSNDFCKRNYYKIVNCGRLLSNFFKLYFYFLILTLTLYTIVLII